VLGEEWSSAADLEDVLTRYLFPCLRPDAHVAEIGVGGGRVARYVRGRCARLTCMDLSSKMLERAKPTLLEKTAEAEAGPAVAALEFVLLDPRAPAAYPARLAGALDVVYAFDVLVHVDLHIIFQVFQGARRLLKQGGRAVFSTANLLTPAGWRRFERQSKYTAAGFYCE
jgi:SAM-dependent methyltransferase